MIIVITYYDTPKLVTSLTVEATVGTSGKVIPSKISTKDDLPCTTTQPRCSSCSPDSCSIMAMAHEDVENGGEVIIMIQLRWTAVPTV